MINRRHSNVQKIKHHDSASNADDVMSKVSVRFTLLKNITEEQDISEEPDGRHIDTANIHCHDMADEGSKEEETSSSEENQENITVAEENQENINVAGKKHSKRKILRKQKQDIKNQTSCKERLYNGPSRDTEKIMNI